MNEAAVTIRGLTKAFGGREIIRNCSMNVEKGSIYGFLGKNGAAVIISTAMCQMMAIIMSISGAIAFLVIGTIIAITIINNLKIRVMNMEV